MNIGKLDRGAAKYVNDREHDERGTRIRKNVAGAVAVSYPAWIIFSCACASSVGLPGSDSSSQVRRRPCFGP